MTMIHGGNPSYGIAGEKVIVRNLGKDSEIYVDTECYFTGLDLDVGHGGDPHWVFHTSVTSTMLMDPARFVEATYTTEEEHEDELLVLVFS